MRKNQTSITALGIAVLRAVESEKPEGQRICVDPYARRFIPGWFYQMMRLFITTGYAERRGRGVIGFLVARERYIDDTLEGWLREGIDQLVILGAGYDSRAHRFPALVERGIRVFEVDHPATQQVKIARIRQIFGGQPGHVTYVAVDFNTQSLASCLSASGYKPQAKTAFLWQGVTYYLDSAAVDGTLDFIARQSGPGSSVIFDFIDETLLAHASTHGEVKGMRRYQGMTGEALRFGIPIHQIEPYLSQRGFTQVRNVCSEDLKAAYFHGKNAARNVMAGYGIVSAAVQGKQVKGD